MIYEFSDSKTPQNYWLAKSFILLGDIYLSRKDEFQARATYQSVVDGYSPADDGIVDEAKAKIAKITSKATKPFIFEPANLYSLFFIVPLF